MTIDSADFRLEIRHCLKPSNPYVWEIYSVRELKRVKRRMSMKRLSRDEEFLMMSAYQRLQNRQPPPNDGCPPQARC
jgi:hypothetical protein